MCAETENVAGNAGMGKAMEIAAAGIPERAARETALRERLKAGLQAAVSGIRINGHPTDRLAGNLHVTIPGVAGEAMLLRLDLAGIAASSGSACTSGSTEPSHVLEAIGLTDEEIKSSLRLTIGEENTEAEIDETIRKITEIAADLRSMRDF